MKMMCELLTAHMQFCLYKKSIELTYLIYDFGFGGVHRQILLHSNSYERIHIR